MNLKNLPYKNYKNYSLLQVKKEGMYLNILQYQTLNIGKRPKKLEYVVTVIFMVK